MAIDTHEGKTTKAPTGLERRCVWGGTEGGEGQGQGEGTGWRDGEESKWRWSAATRDRTTTNSSQGKAKGRKARRGKPEEPTNRQTTKPLINHQAYESDWT